MSEHHDIHIRDFVEADLMPVKHLIDYTIDTNYTGVYPPNAVRFFKKFHSEERILEEAKKGNMILVEQKGKIVATGAIIGNHVFRVFVVPQFHRHGYGKAIMSDLETKAKMNGLEEIVLEVSLPSKRFYESLGYSLYEEASLDVGDGESLDYYKARKLLNKGDY